ncbi:MAG: DNA polymerase III subunit delta [Candidatus Saccharimonadales bacterium]
MITVYTGTNNYALTQAVRQQTNAFNGEVEQVDGSTLEIRDLPDLFMGATLFSSDRLLVIRGLSANKTVWAELDRWLDKVPVETEMLVIEQSPDKRTRTYKQLQKIATIKEFKDLAEHELVAWVQAHARSQGVDLMLDSARYLVNYVGHDQWRLQSELDKLLLAEKLVTPKLIQEIAEPYPEATAFELLDSMLKGDEARVRELLDLLSQREDPYQFFGLLSSQVFALLAVVSGGTRGANEIAKDMGVHPFVVSKLSPFAKKLGEHRVGLLVQQLAHCDERIKTSGVEPWYQLKLTLLQITSAR